MRFAFLGKGGSGKTTVAASFINYLLAKQKTVLAVDADVNVHLAQALSIDVPATTSFLSDEVYQLREILKGQRKDLGSRPLLGSTPPATQSHLISLTGVDPVLARFAYKKDRLHIIRVGNYDESDIGDSCYHAKLSSLASFLHHLLDSENEIVVADTTAGTDNVATSLAFAYDVNIFVVEPTIKSIAVYHDFIEIASRLRETTYVIGNKVENNEDEAFLIKRVGTERYLGSIPYSRALKKFEQGNSEQMSIFLKHVEPMMNNILDTAIRHPRNWMHYLQQLKSNHKLVSTEWANAMYGCDLVNGLDETFDYENALNAMRLKTSTESPTPV